MMQQVYVIMTDEGDLYCVASTKEKAINIMIEYIEEKYWFPRVIEPNEYQAAIRGIRENLQADGFISASLTDLW